MNTGLRCEGVGLHLPGSLGREKAVLQNVTAVFPPGCISLVAGDTGAGKTSLIHALACLVRPTRGRVFDGEHPVSAWTSSHQDRWRRGVGIAFQHPRLLDRMTVQENAMLPLVPRGGPPGTLRRKSWEVMERLGIAHLATQKAITLSGGEAQRAALARALVAAPRIVLADEPTSHQDGPGFQKVMEALRFCRGADAVVVVTSHDRRLLESHLPDRCHHLVSGCLEYQP